MVTFRETLLLKLLVGLRSWLMPWLLIFGLSGVVRADGVPCHVEMTNGDEADMIMHGVGERHLQCSFAFLPESVLNVEYERIQHLSFSDQQPVVPKVGDRIQLQDYSLLHGTFLKIEDGQVRFELMGGPAIHLPLSAVSRISRHPLPASSDLVPQDKFYGVRTKNGDKLSGRLRQVSADRFEITSDEIAASLSTTNIAIIQFPMPELLVGETNATPTETTTNVTPTALYERLYVEVHTLNGGRVYGQNPSLQGMQLAFDMSSGPRISVNMEQVKTLSFTRSMIPNARSVLVWEQFADQDEESERTISILKKGLQDWSIHRHKDAPAGPEFRARLLSSRALVVPEMENLRSDVLDAKVRVGEGPEVKWKDLLREQVRPILSDYVRRGGRIVFLCLEPEHATFIKALNLIEYEVGDRSKEQKISFTPAGAKIAKGIGAAFETTDATAFYKVKAPAVAWAADDKNLAPIFYQKFGPGSVIVMGMDYFEQNSATETLLLNAVQVR